jgi:hypothetical protein
VKLSNYPKESPELKLLVRSSFSKTLFSSAYSLPIYCSIDNEVDNMASTAYAVVHQDVDVGVQVEAPDELSVVVCCIITHKAVELSGYFILIKHSMYDSPLESFSMVSAEVMEGNNNILLFIVGICRCVSYFEFH